jgi:hypothetical protein
MASICRLRPGAQTPAEDEWSSARSVLARVRVTLRGMSFCIARGAVNSAVRFGTGREQTGLAGTRAWYCP